MELVLLSIEEQVFGGEIIYLVATFCNEYSCSADNLFIGEEVLIKVFGMMANDLILVFGLGLMTLVFNINREVYCWHQNQKNYSRKI